VRERRGARADPGTPVGLTGGKGQRHYAGIYYPTLSLVDGPFQHLSGEWLFDPLGDKGSKVTLVLNFDFSSRVLSSAFRRGFTRIADRLVYEFSKRADDIYGN
jgi:hypothetical protein